MLYCIVKVVELHSNISSILIEIKMTFLKAMGIKMTSKLILSQTHYYIAYFRLITLTACFEMQAEFFGQKISWSLKNSPFSPKRSGFYQMKKSQVVFEKSNDLLWQCPHRHQLWTKIKSCEKKLAIFCETNRVIVLWTCLYWKCPCTDIHRKNYPVNT